MALPTNHSRSHAAYKRVGSEPCDHYFGEVPAVSAFEDQRATLRNEAQGPLIHIPLV
jgi:hypothetical protein